MIKDGWQLGHVHALSLLRVPICRHAFRSILGIGAIRFQKLYNAVKSGTPAPLDLRYKPKKFLRKNPSRNRQLIVEFLEELYATISEPLPEALGKSVQNPEAKKSAGALPSKMRFRRHRGRKPKVVASARRAKGRDGSRLRMLPPGTYTSYLELLKLRWPEAKLTLKVFTQAPCHVVSG